MVEDPLHASVLSGDEQQQGNEAQNTQQEMEALSAGQVPFLGRRTPLLGGSSAASGVARGLELVGQVVLWPEVSALHEVVDVCQACHARE